MLVLGNPGGVGVVYDVNFAAEVLGKHGVYVGAYPRFVDIGGRTSHATANDGRNCHTDLADLARLREVGNDLANYVGDGKWGGWFGCGDSKSIRG